jgi:hypothetical protein
VPKQRKARRDRHNTEGKRLLNLVLESMSQEALSKDLRVQQQAISNWKLGSARPETHYREALERVTERLSLETGVPVIGFDTWYTDEELAIARGPFVTKKKTGTDD